MHASISRWFSSCAFLLLIDAAMDRAGAQCSTVWLPGSGLQNATGSVSATTLWDPDGLGPAKPVLVVGGGFTTAGSVQANNIGILDPVSGAWSALGTGMNGVVAALTSLPNGDLVAGGFFTAAGGVSASRIARWDGTAWSPLGSGITGGLQPRVFALAALANGDLVVGGAFSIAGGMAVGNIARWDGTAWSTFGSGTDGLVSVAIVVPNGELVVGGYFATAGGTSVNNLARWTGTTWSSLGSGLGSGLQQSVLALAQLPNGDLVAGGQFWPFAHIARWNGASWSALGSGMNSSVHALTTLPNGDVVAGGFFFTAGGVGASHIARWDGATWAPIGSGMNSSVSALTNLPNGDVMAGGAFTTAGAVASTYLARLTTTCPAMVASYGAGCSGSAGTVALTATSLPWAGGILRARATGLTTNSLAVGVFSFSQVSIPLASAHPQGLPGCLILVDDEILIEFSVGAGTVQTQIAIPNLAALVGSNFFHQVVPVETDASGNIAAITSTNALTLTVGAF